ncbi:hypothetical protein LIER_27371 [Lithospermum erythrorhizon]|uniref:Uncharacterized protein n=1 Tax=Lithospermum erythrorhizon TaxID=34254 RepID=A0AAV3RHR1_LITER
MGLPSYIGRKKKDVFRFVWVKAEGKIAGWKGKFLSQAGREILVKSVAATIPNYVMNCFKFSIGIIEELNKVMAKFWWAGSGKESGIHWKKWSTMSMNKEKGGLVSRTWSV